MSFVYSSSDQSLPNPFEIRRKNRPRIFPYPLGRRHDVRANVLTRVPCTQQQVSIEPALSLCQSMAHLLESLGQTRIIEHETNVVFGDPQPFPRPIGRSIEYPRQVRAAARLAQVERRDSIHELKRFRIRQRLLRQSLPQRLRLEPRGLEQLGSSPGRGQQPGEKMLGPHFSFPVDPRMHHCFAQHQPETRRKRQRLGRYRSDQLFLKVQVAPFELRQQLVQVWGRALPTASLA